MLPTANVVHAIAIREGDQGIYALIFYMRDGTVRQHSLITLRPHPMVTSLSAEELEASIPHPGQVTILQPGELIKYVAVATEMCGLDVIEAGILCSGIRIITSNLRYIVGGIQEAFLSYPPSIVDTRGERDNHITNVTFNRGAIISYTQSHLQASLLHKGILFSGKLKRIGLGFAHHVHGIVLDFGDTRAGEVRSDAGQVMDLNDPRIAWRITWRSVNQAVHGQINNNDFIKAIKGMGTIKTQFLCNQISIYMGSGAVLVANGTNKEERSSLLFSIEAPTGKQIRKIWFSNGCYQGHTTCPCPVEVEADTEVSLQPQTTDYIVEDMQEMLANAFPP